MDYLTDEEMDLFLSDLLKALAEKEEVVGMTDELAGRMAEMTIGEQEDEIAEAQGTMHDLRVVEAKREEQVKLLKAEKRRIEFALEELGERYD
jgi:hypothetical protein